MAKDEAHLKVGAHVLIQLGSELVTDVEQAILECVKNAYDADSPWCKIDIDTKVVGTVVETGGGNLQDFRQNSETVTVEIRKGGKVIGPNVNVEKTDNLERLLHYKGKITIEDNGTGLDASQIDNSWLVISWSQKRSGDGQPKKKTKLGRTPLGDKGLGRLGSMKLGDVLRIETATSPKSDISVAQFRWGDCQSARTIEEIPVFRDTITNEDGLKGTRVSILGLNEIEDWRSPERISDITKGLARLISPFEAASTFPVGIKLDDVDHSLVAITDELLKQAVADFNFKYKVNPKTGEGVLVCEAKFQKRLFTSSRNPAVRRRTEEVFGIDGGAGFLKHLISSPKLNHFKREKDAEDGAFITLKHDYKFSDLKPMKSAPMVNPGGFDAAFYYFNLDRTDAPDKAAVASLAVTKKLIKSMAGIAILRDGFRVRAQGDWLDLSSGMTSGSTYNLRPDNTAGYFSLTGEQNYLLTEKSDREGFVEDAAYRGFLTLALQAKTFANDALEGVRRGLDEYANSVELPKDAPVAKSPEESFDVVSTNLRSAREARAEADAVVSALQAEIKQIEKTPNLDAEASTTRALAVANNAFKAIELVRNKLAHGSLPDYDLIRLRQEYEVRSDQLISLLESAAVGLSARGLAHELRTQLTEIRQNVASIEKASKRKSFSADDVVPALRAIKSSCGNISNAAALIDPMLPRARSVKTTIELKPLIEDYIKTRVGSLDNAGIRTVVKGAGRTVRANKSRLLQVIDNLVRNSIYWIRRADAEKKQKRPKEIEFQLTRTGFVVSDSGPGVDERYEESLFEMFVTAKPPGDGQGLGLFIIHELLKNEGCDVVLLDDRNADGRRYRFSVDLTPLLKV